MCIIEETPKYKSLYFDLHIKSLKNYYSSTNPKGGYARIHNFLTKRKFSHEQYSAYHSTFKTTDLQIFDLITEMRTQLPWLDNCVSHFEVANLGANHNLLPQFEESLPTIT